MNNLPIPQSRSEELMNAFIQRDSSQISTPQSRIEEFWYHLIEGTNSLPIPQSRNELLLKKIIENDTHQIPLAQSRTEEFLVSILTGDINKLPIPQSRSEYYLDYIARNNLLLNDIDYVRYSGTNITATNTVQKPFRSANLKGSTKYRDIETGEILDVFEDGRNLELVSVQMPDLTTSDTAFIDNKVALKIDATSNPSGQIAINTVNGYKIQLNNPSSVADVGFNGDCLISGENVYFSYDYNDKLYACEVIYEQHEQTSGSVWGFFVEGSFQVHQGVRSIVSKKAGWFETKFPVFEYNQKIHILFVNDFEKKTKSIFLNGDRIAYAERVSFANTDFNAETITFLQNITGKIYKLTLYNQPLTDEEIIAIFKYEDKTNKTNILTVNEDVELRGIGEVQDTLDCLTGEVTKRVLEYSITGDEGWVKHSTTNTFYTMDGIVKYSDNKRNVISDKFYGRYVPSNTWLSNMEICVFGSKIGIGFDGTLEELIEYLKLNNPRIFYVDEEKSVKTVGLKVVNQDGNHVKELSAFDGTTYIVSGSASDNSLIAITEVEVPTKLIEVLDGVKSLSSDVEILINEVDNTQKLQDENSTMAMSAMTELYEMILMMGGND